MFRQARIVVLARGTAVSVPSLLVALPLTLVTVPLVAGGLCGRLRRVPDGGRGIGR